MDLEARVARGHGGTAPRERRPPTLLASGGSTFPRRECQNPATSSTVHINEEQLNRQERLFADAFAAADLARARALYHQEVVYLSPTVRLFAWPSRIEGVDKTLEFIQLTIRSCRDIRYEAVEMACLPGGDSAFARIEFDWNAGPKRLRSTYVVLYRYRQGLIRQQELYYDPSAALEELPPCRV